MGGADMCGATFELLGAKACSAGQGDTRGIVYGYMGGPDGPDI